MTTPPPAKPRVPWVGEQLTAQVVSRMNATELRVYSLVCWRAATRTRTSFNVLGLIVGDNNVPIGAASAQRIVNDLHDQGLVLVHGWNTAKNDTPLAYFVSHMPPPPRLPRHLRQGEDRVKVGGRFTAPSNLDPELLDNLVGTGELIRRHNDVPTDERDSRWTETLAVYTEARAAAFHTWAVIDAARAVQQEADRLTQAAATIHQQAVTRRQTEEDKRRRTADNKPTG